MRPRTMGALSMRVTPGALPSASNSATWSGSTLMKKNAGASRDRSRARDALRFRSIWAMPTSAVRPRPSAKTMFTVGAPGRWMEASPSRTLGLPACGARRAPARRPQATTRNTAKHPAHPTMKPKASRASGVNSHTSPASTANPDPTSTRPTPDSPLPPPATYPRNRVAGRTDPASSSGRSEKASRMASPSRAARSRGAAWMDASSCTGMSWPVSPAARGGTAAPSAHPATMPAPPMSSI